MCFREVQFLNAPSSIFFTLSGIISNGNDEQFSKAFFLIIFILFGNVIASNEVQSANAYDSISKEELAKLKDHIGVFIENVLSQESIEGAYNTDKQTGLYNNLYLYSNVRQKTSAEENSVLTLIQLVNLPEINEEFGREVGNKLVEKAANLMKEVFNEENIFIRYSGSKFCIVSLGASAEQLHGTVERYISNVKMQEENSNGQRVTLDTNAVMSNIRKQSNIDRELNRMSEYVEGMKDMNTIKII